MIVTVKLEVVKNVNLNYPRFSTPGPVSKHFDEMGYEVTMGVGNDLMEAAKSAVRDMIRFISGLKDISEAEAYMLCSVCAGLRISEIVDAPDWIVSYYFPKIVLA